MHQDVDVVQTRRAVVPFPEGLSPSARLHFVEASVFEEPRLPFALVKYTLDGVPITRGLRLDIDKRIFLDHFDDEDIESAAVEGARNIVSFLGTQARHRRSIGAGAGD